MAFIPSVSSRRVPGRHHRLVVRIRTFADSGDNVRHDKTPLAVVLVPDRPDFPVIVEAKGEFLRHAVNPISTCRPGRQHRAYKHQYNAEQNQPKGLLAFVKMEHGEKQMPDLCEQAQKPPCDMLLELINQKPDRANQINYTVPFILG